MKRPKPWQDVRMLMRDYVYAALKENEKRGALSAELREAFGSALAALRKNTRRLKPVPSPSADTHKETE